MKKNIQLDTTTGKLEAVDLTTGGDPALTDGSNADSLHKHAELHTPDNTKKIVDVLNSGVVVVGENQEIELQPGSNQRVVFRDVDSDNVGSVIVNDTELVLTIDNNQAPSITNSQFKVRGSGNDLFLVHQNDARFHMYPNTRDDGQSLTGKALYVDVDGRLRFGRIPPYGDMSKSTVINSNQSTTLLVQNSLTPTIPETGRYKVEVVFPWSMNVGSTDFIGELRSDGVTLYRHRQEVKDVAGTGVNSIRLDGGANLNTGTDQRHTAIYRDIVGYNKGDTPLIEFLFAASSTFDRPAVYGSLITIERFA